MTTPDKAAKSGGRVNPPPPDPFRAFKLKAMFPRVLILYVIVLTSTAAHAQWWSFGPRDYEDCAASAEKASTSETRKSLISECDSKFAGRRKAGGGYTYFDFMQNRSFDIAGPNPTPEELRAIDQEYIGHLERERRSAITAAFLAKQRELALAGSSAVGVTQTCDRDARRAAVGQSAASAAKEDSGGASRAMRGGDALVQLVEILDRARSLFGLPKPAGSTRS